MCERDFFAQSHALALLVKSQLLGMRKYWCGPSTCVGLQFRGLVHKGKIVQSQEPLETTTSQKPAYWHPTTSPEPSNQADVFFCLPLGCSQSPEVGKEGAAMLIGLWESSVRALGCCWSPPDPFWKTSK